MTVPGGLLGPAPYAPQPSILDRLAARLFPTASYTGLLGADQQQGLGRQGLLNLGTNLLQIGGANPTQRGTLANIGGALAGAQANFPEMAQRALQLQALNQQIQERHAIDDVARRHAPQPGEKPEQTYERIAGMVADLAGRPGTEDLVGKLGGVLAALKPTSDRADWMLQFGVGADGQPGLFRVNRLTGEVRPTGLGKPAAPQTPAERVAASQLASVANSVDRMEEIAAQNPAAVNEAIAAIKVHHVPYVGRALEAFRNLGLSPEAQEFVTQFKNFQLGVTPTYGGSRPTQQLLDLEEASSLPGIGAGGAARAAAFAHMRARVNDLRAKAGAAARMEGGPAGQPAPPAVPIAPAFNPKFWAPN